jgi:hypothetical protein
LWKIVSLYGRRRVGEVSTPRLAATLPCRHNPLRRADGTLADAAFRRVEEELDWAELDWAGLVQAGEREDRAG